MIEMVSKSQSDASKSFYAEREGLQQTNSTSTKKHLLRRLRKGQTARTRLLESNLDKKLAFQMRALRGDLSQSEMKEKVGIDQQGVSRLENPYYGKQSLTTLKRYAAAFDVALLVEFVPYSELISRISQLNPEAISVPSFKEEEDEGGFADIDAAPERNNDATGLPEIPTRRGNNPVQYVDAGLAAKGNQESISDVEMRSLMMACQGADNAYGASRDSGC